MDSTKPTIIYTAWPWGDNIAPVSLQQFANHIKDISNAHVIYMAPEEYTFGGGMNLDMRQRKEFLYDVIDATSKRNVTISVVVGRHPDSFIHDYETAFNLFCFLEIIQPLRNFVDVYFWKEFWFFNTAISYLPYRYGNPQNLVMSERGYAVPEHVLTPDIKQVFCCLNRMPHRHRCCLVDEFANNQDLWNKNIITWLITEDEYHRSQGTMEYEGYPWKHWKQTQIVKEQFHFSNGFPNYCATEPQGYYQCLFDVVPETDGDIVFWTEKTVRSIVNFKPFLVAGGRHANHKLKELGFELYDEIFNYGFDECLDYRKRTKLLASGLADLTRKAQEPMGCNMLNNRYIEVREKLYHNFENLLRIMQDGDQIPFRAQISDAYPKYESILAKNKNFVQCHFPGHLK
jgi:hypothetical protein